MEKKYPICLIILSVLTFACSSSPVNNANSQQLVTNSPAVANQNSVKTVLTKVSVDEISEAFAKDKNRFAELCSGKVIVVTGAFGSIEDNKEEGLVTVKSATNAAATVKVIFKNFNTDRIYEMEDGQKVVVQGKCETAADGFVIKGTNIFLAKEGGQESTETERGEKIKPSQFDRNISPGNADGNK